MAERLAKRKAAKDRQDILDSLSGGLSYGKSGVDITPQLSQVGGMVKGLIQMPGATIMDIASGIVRPLEKYVGGVKDPVDQYRPEDYGTSNLITGTAQGLEQAGRRAVGDITAIPYVGKPSASPTATDIKRYGVVEGLSKAGIDYGNLALTAAPFVKPSAWGISNAYQDMLQARIARQNAPAYRYTGDFIDVDALQGSRLPARIVDTPASPATRLAEAQTQRALPPAATQGMTIDELNQFARTINADKQIVRADTNALPEFWGGEPMINDRLRGDYLQNEFDTQIANAKEFFQNIPALERPVKVFRGIMVEEPSAGVNAFSDFVRTWKVGDVIEEPGFMSTTIDRDMAEGFANDGIVLEIDIPKGAKVATPTMFGDIYQSIENELTLPPNSKYQITQIDGKNIKAKIVPAETITTNFQNTRDELLRYTENTPATPATRLAEAQTQRALTPAQVAPIEVAPTTSRLTPPAFRERQVPTSTKITVESSGIADPNVEKRFTIRAYDEGLKEYKGVLVMRWDPGAQKAIIDEMSSTNAMATPQLISAAAHIIRKTYGDIKFPIEPSSSLSAYSRPFVERLQQAGLIDSNYVLPNSNNLNEIDRYNYTPTDIASPNVKGEKIVSPLAYQPTYNEVLKSLVESRRQAKLQGEYGRLTTPSNKLINEEQITNGFDDPRFVPNEVIPVVDYRIINGNSNEPKIIESLNDTELETLVDNLRRDPSNPMDLIDIAKRNDPDYLTNIFAIPSYLHINNLIGSAEKIILSREINQRLMVDSRPARMAKFINDHIDPEWPELKRYLQRYGSVENFVNSSEAFTWIRFLEPFFESERNGL